MELADFVENNRITIRVKPNARTSEVLKLEEIPLVGVAAPPENNKANKELEKFLTKELGRKATIKSGFTNKKKIIVLE